ncbi:MAG: thioesterase [Gammaproteobacteria bacterium]|uniref:Acyl-coenzyme A thioesterase THEM4 n=1 Tax=OM182 bacterium TaxID=2510334 RepID=A0A520S1C7_9GAMM|nr:thioesterase [Gammaproteobacteria bacterium]RZO76275.1 MAG: PaaI family thioesterase [OM182 bacterium]
MNLRSDANHCFVCGPNNSIGLKLMFRMEDEICKSEFTPEEEHCGYDGVTHGGIVYSVLDDVMANWLFLRGVRAFTAACEIRYKNPLAIGTRVFLEGKCVKEKSRIALLEGKMLRKDNRQLIAETHAKFMKIFME